MTNTEWHAIVKAWAAWVCGEGPPVQLFYDGKWIDHLNCFSILSADSCNWRIKPNPVRVRMYLSNGQVCVAKLSRPGPGIVLVPGDQWLGEWQEVPE